MAEAGIYRVHYSHVRAYLSCLSTGRRLRDVLFKETRQRWRAARLYGAAERAASAGDDVRALSLVTQALESLDLCKAKENPGAIAILMTATILFDSVSERLNKERSRERLLVALSATEKFADVPQLGEARRWLRHRLENFDAVR
jgi:hypothetical protein